MPAVSSPNFTDVRAMRVSLGKALSGGRKSGDGNLISPAGYERPRFLGLTVAYHYHTTTNPGEL